MEKKRMSLSFIISVSFTVLIIVTFSLIGFLVFSSWKTSAASLVGKMEYDTNRSLTNQIENHINEPLNINAANHGLIANQIIDLNNKKQREMYFAGVIKATKNEVYSFSFGTETGEYYGARRNAKNEIEIIENNSQTGGKSRYFSVTRDLTAGALVTETGNFDPRARDWYIAAKEKKEPIFSPIYQHFVMDDLAISAAYPIYNKNGTLKGVLGTHITLARINNYLKEGIKGKQATAYIIEKETGQLVANSLGKPNFAKLADNQIKRYSVLDIDDKPIINAYQSYRKNIGRHFVVKETDGKVHVNVTEYKKAGLDWLIITAIPESQFTAGMVKSINLSILLSIIALLITILISVKSTNIFLKPIYDLITASERFSHGDLLYRAKVYHYDEIGKLSNAFNEMAEQLYTLINALEEKVSERTAELKQANAALKNSESNIRLLLDSTAEAIYGVDTDGNCTFCNASCLTMLGYQSQSDLLGKNMHRQIHHKHADGSPLPIEDCEVHKALINGAIAHVNHEVLWRADGTCFPAEYFSYPQYRDEKIVGAVVTFLDITERKQTEEEIVYLSYHDQLTNLYNRRYFEEELKRLDVPRNLPVTIIMADINGLKLVNDSFGHIMGDALLKKAAETIVKGCRADDMVARLGGDEFVLLLPKTEPHEAEQIIKRIKDMAAEERVGSVEISISFGYGTKYDEDEKIEDIFKKAEDHMYKNKLSESPGMRGKTVNVIINTLCEKNKIEQLHYHRVSDLCERMARAIGLPEDEVVKLKTVAFLHDIGKIAIKDSILKKPGPLTDEEWEEVKRHSEIGYRILSTVNDMAGLAEYVLAHHERWDGNGYPKGLRGTEIPLPSRIITIADAYEAMTGERSYRRSLTGDAVKGELLNNAGTQFDPELVKVFIEQVLER